MIELLIILLTLVLAVVGTVVIVVREGRRRHAEQMAFERQKLEIEIATRWQQPVPGDDGRVRLPLATAPPVCGNCAHWDLEDGQAQLQEQKHFMLAAQHMSPAMMSRDRKFDGRGNPLPDDEQPEESIPSKAKWTEFGACAFHREGRWMLDKCENHASEVL